MAGQPGAAWTAAALANPAAMQAYSSFYFASSQPATGYADPPPPGVAAPAAAPNPAAAAAAQAAYQAAYPAYSQYAAQTATQYAWPAAQYYQAPATAAATVTGAYSQVTVPAQPAASFQSTSAQKYPPIADTPWRKKQSANTFVQQQAPAPAAVPQPAPQPAPSYSAAVRTGASDKPAYIQVGRRDAPSASGNVSANPAPVKQESAASSFAPGLKAYVTKAMQICPTKNRDHLQDWLRTFLAEIGDAQWTKDWDREPLPPPCSDDFVPPKPAASIPTPVRTPGKAKKRRNPLSESDTEDPPPVAKLRTDELAKREKRARRFDSPQPAAAPRRPVLERLGTAVDAEPNPDVIDWDRHTIVGTSQVLEKHYLRLTSAPDPANVRPLEVCRQTLKLLKRKWKDEANYAYICDQFKSLRQDLTVQRIRNAFTIDVYETHARIALEKGDLGEFNQCQSQLKHLYKEVKGAGHENEFKAYRVLYCLYTLNRRDINNLLQDLTAADRKDPQIAHALAVRKAVAHRDYHQLFRLYRNYPNNMSPYLIDHFAERERIYALKIMCAAYRMSRLDVGFVAEELGWTGPDGLAECVAQLEKWKVPLLPIEPAADDMDLEGTVSMRIDTKEGARVVAGLWKQFQTVDIKGQQ
ncbi:SAC3/GANP/Nin1/mts3/eIF-3 p25 family-domain-containing protein [Hyaloraphidium curvatum]|nr:SAC3/GANP/Nin1/mts3/eIF-3 p25 family-domain-containing protein [Hyaloraphidium curvatum]